MRRNFLLEVHAHETVTVLAPGRGGVSLHIVSLLTIRSRKVCQGPSLSQRPSVCKDRRVVSRSKLGSRDCCRVDTARPCTNTRTSWRPRDVRENQRHRDTQRWPPARSLAEANGSLRASSMHGAARVDASVSTPPSNVALRSRDTIAAERMRRALWSACRDLNVRVALCT